MPKAAKEKTVSSGRSGQASRARQPNESNPPRRNTSPGDHAESVPSHPTNGTDARATKKRPSSSSEAGPTCKRTKSDQPQDELDQSTTHSAIDQSTTNPAIDQSGQSCQVCLSAGDTFALCSAGHRTCKSCLKKEILQVFVEDKSQLICKATGCTNQVKLESLTPMEPSFSIGMVRDHLNNKSLQVSEQAIRAMQQLVRCPRCNYPAELEPDNQVFCCPNNQCQAFCCRGCRTVFPDGLSEADKASCYARFVQAEHAGCPLFQLFGSPCLSDLNVFPEMWTAHEDRQDQENGYVSVEVTKTSSEYQLVVNFLRTNESFSAVKKIMRIQNQRTWSQFALKRQQMVDAIGEPRLAEMWMLHGTAPTNTKRICREGLDYRKDREAKTNNQFGNGLVVTKGQFYDQNFNKTKRVFVCRVLAGLSGLGAAGYNHPPYDNTTGRMFNSCVDKLASPTTHVIFDNDQVYPAYLVELSN